MTTSEREDIELLAESVCMNHLKDRELPCPSCKMIIRAIRAQVEKARAEERERCAKIAENFEAMGAVLHPMQTKNLIAYLIRNKLNQKGE